MLLILCIQKKSSNLCIYFRDTLQCQITELGMNKQCLGLWQWIYFGAENILNALHYVWFSQFWSHFPRTMHCLPQRLKSTLFEIFSNGVDPKGPVEWEKISNNIDFSLWGNCATTQNISLTFSSETKIMKITHSAINDV